MRVYSQRQKRPVQTRFRYGSAPDVLNHAAESNSPVHYAKGTRSPAKRRSESIGLPQLVSAWFQVLLTPLVGVLFTFQSPYFPLSVVEEYLALEGGPPSFTQSSTSSVLLWYAVNNAGLSLSHTGLSPSMVGLSRPFCWRCLCNCLTAPATPKSKLSGLG